VADEYVEFEVDVNDKASPKLSKLEKNIGKVGGAVDRASSNFVGMIKQSAMMASFFALGPAIAGAKNYINHLDKISDLTGIAADRVGGISNALQGSGVSAEGVESVFARLVKKGAQVAEGNKALIKLGKKYGVTIKEGPEEALLGVSKLLEKGKISAGGMQRILGISSDDAADMAEALAQGPDELKKSFDELTKKNAAFNDDAMAGMQEWHNSSNRIGVAWSRMTAGIMIKLAPALTKLSTKFEGSIENWTASAEKFGNFLVNHMDKLIAMAKTYAKIMLVNATVQKLTGMGLGGIASKGVGMVQSKMRQPGVTGVGSAIASIVGPFLKGFTSFRPIISGLLKLAPIGGVIMLIVAAVRALGENFNGITTRLKSTFGGVFQTIVRIGSKIAALFSGDSAIGQFFGAVGYAFLEVVNKIGEVIGFILTMVEKIVELIPSIFKASAADVMFSKTKKQAQQNLMGDATTRVAKAAPVAPKKGKQTSPETQVYQDFRGSRFDIKQAFAEGFDPDRIAVAFANDISSIGERKLQSGFSPLFAVR